MSSINLRQALTSQQQATITHKDLDCLIKWKHQFVLEDDHFFGCNFVFKSGTPGKYISGEWGYYLYGDLGLHIRPTPDPLDHRTTMRYGETPRYEYKLGSLYHVIAPYTNYYWRDKVTLENPMMVVEEHLAALSDVLSNYLRYLVYKIFVGPKTKDESWYVKTWAQAYIEPADGENNGFTFMLHKGYGEVNLSKVLTPQDKKENALKKRLEAINAALRNDTRKTEVDVAQNELCKTKWVKENLSPSSLKTLALFDTVRTFARKIITQGNFGDTKYKHKNEEGYWKDYMPRVRETGGLIFLLNKTAWQKLKDQIAMSNPVTSFISESDFPGRLILTDLVDADEGILLESDLIQIWVLNELIKYGTYNYDNPGEMTRDFIYELSHSLDTVDIFSSAYFKNKA